MSPLLTRILNLVDRLKGAGEGEPQIGESLRRLIHSRALDIAVALTPNKADDAILATLRELFPAPPVGRA